MSKLFLVDKDKFKWYTTIEINNVQTGAKMGVIFKLKPEIIDFILQAKKANPALSCRKLVFAVEEKYQIKVSKSSVNSIFKTAGLSLPVGRRPKKKRIRPQAQLMLPAEIKADLPVQIKPEEPILAPLPIVEPVAAIPPSFEKLQPEIPSLEECTGAILLKAADYLLGGSEHIATTIDNKLKKGEEDLLAKVECLIYLNLLGLDKESQKDNLARLWPILDKRPSFQDLCLYLEELQRVKAISGDILRGFLERLQEVRCIKLETMNGDSFYLDGQMHTIWSTPYISYDFSSTICNTKSYINKYFYKDYPFVLFMAPGYDAPSKEFFDFIRSFSEQEKSISKLTLSGNKFEELEVIRLGERKKGYFVFGLWPGQFVGYRQVNKIGEYKPIRLEALKKDLYLAEIELTLSQPNAQQSVRLKGYAMKNSLSEKARFIILSNLPPWRDSPEQIADLYFGHWPCPEEAFQDFSRKIELFSYTASSQRFFSTENLNLKPGLQNEIEALFDSYLKALDSYAKWHFLPSGYENCDFPTIKERFYGLKASIRKEEQSVLATFLPPSGYPYLKDLEYACLRINEREVLVLGGKRLRLSI